MQLMNAKSLRALMLVILVALVGSGLLVYGQGTSGSLTGQVSDPTGAAVANATVMLKNVDTDSIQTTTSDKTGVYLLKPVMPGNYFAHHHGKRLCRVRAERHRHHGRPLRDPGRAS